MPDPFIAAAGPAPARGTESRWRQVALLAASAALGDSAQASAGLAATLLSLDHPEAAAAALRTAPPDDPWARWWRVLAAGQSAGVEGLDEVLAAALREPAEGPDGREVARRLADLEAELAALRGGDPDPARFARPGPPAPPGAQGGAGRALVGAFLAEPGWDALRLVRLAPSEGPALGIAPTPPSGRSLPRCAAERPVPAGPCPMTLPRTPTPRPCSRRCARTPPPATGA